MVGNLIKYLHFMYEAKTVLKKIHRLLLLPCAKRKHYITLNYVFYFHL